MSSASSAKPDTLTNLLALLPTGTYLAFATIVPIITNNGNCNLAEKIVAGVFVFVFAFLCTFTTFTDSLAAGDGRVWYGVVTKTGLWNPFFASSDLLNVTGWTFTGGGTKYTLKLADFYIAILSLISFLSLTLLSTDLQACYYSGINPTVVKSIPLPVNFLVGIALSFAPPSRHSVGFAFAVTTSSESSSTATTPAETVTRAAPLLGNSDSSDV